MVESIHAIPAHVPPERVFPFDFRYDPGFRTDPWGLVGSLGDKPDIFYAPNLGGYWVVTRCDLIEEVFRRYDLFSNKIVSIPEIPGAPALIPHNFDPPEHTGYRKILAQKMFSPRALGSLEEDARQMTRSIVEALRPVGACEFVADIARPLPVDLFLKMMGLPPGRREEFMPWVQGVFRPDSVEESAAAFAAISNFLGTWLDERIADPQKASGHMLPAMLAAEIDGRRLSKEEMLAIWMMLFLGGLDTVTSQMTHIARFLAESPGHRKLLVDDPARIPEATEEMLRRFGIANIGRMVSRDVNFHGVQLKGGDLMLCSTPIAGMDGSKFDDPFKVDFERKNRHDHCAFGSGPHVCPGAYLARIQLKVLIEEMMPRLPNLRVGPGATMEGISGGTLTLKSLPLEWDVA